MALDIYAEGALPPVAAYPWLEPFAFQACKTALGPLIADPARRAFICRERSRASGALLSVLVHFFEAGRWRNFVKTDFEEQSLSAERSALHSHLEQFS